MAKKEALNLTAEELLAKALDIDRELFVIRSEKTMNQKMEKPHRIKMKRKEKARILTALSALKIKQAKEGV